MARRKPTAIYRKILASAWSLTWQRKSLWVFGLFASLVATGGVLEVSFRSLSRIKAGGSFMEQVLTGSFPGYQGFSQYIQLLQTQSPARVATTATLLSLLFITVVIIVILSQGALISGLLAKKERSVRENITAAWPSFWRILLLDFIVKVVSVLLMLLTTLPLALVLIRGSLYDGILYFVLFLILFPAIIIVNIIGMLALVDVVKKKSSVVNALHSAWTIFLRHWLAAFELGLILFFVMLAGMILTFVGSILISIPYAALVALAVLTATPIIYVTINALGVIAVGLVVFIITGAIVTFQHAVWIRFYERASHRNLGKKTIAKIERFWHHF